jgi:Na+/melibiose symporter-like transporter
LIAAVIDSLGSGLFLPVALVYFVHTTPLRLTEVGVGLSAGSALVIPLVPVAGWAVDRYGASRCVIAANALQMTGFLGYLRVSALWELVVFALTVASGQRLFWTANGAFVTLVADVGDQARWFALLRALRNGSFAVGGALAALAIGLASQNAYHALAVLNAVSFLAAGLLVVSWSQRSPDRQADGVRHVRRASRSGPGYRGVFADRAFVLLASVNFLFVLCTLALDVLLTVYVTSSLHRPAWLAGLLFTLSGVVVVATQTMITLRTERHPPTKVLQLAGLFWAISFSLFWAIAHSPTPAVLPGLIVAIVCFTAAETLSMPTLNVVVVSLAPVDQQGRYFAVQGLAWIGPQTIAPAAFTWLLDQGTAWPWISLIMACGLSSVILARLHHVLAGRSDSPA